MCFGLSGADDRARQAAWGGRQGKMPIACYGLRYLLINSWYLAKFVGLFSPCRPSIGLESLVKFAFVFCCSNWVAVREILSTPFGCY